MCFPSRSNITHFSFSLVIRFIFSCSVCVLSAAYVVSTVKFTHYTTTIWCCFLNVHFSFQMCLKIRFHYVWQCIHCKMISLRGVFSASPSTSIRLFLSFSINWSINWYLFCALTHFHSFTSIIEQKNGFKFTFVRDFFQQRYSIRFYPIVREKTTVSLPIHCACAYAVRLCVYMNQTQILIYTGLEAAFSIVNDLFILAVVFAVVVAIFMLPFPKLCSVILLF